MYVLIARRKVSSHSAEGRTLGGSTLMLWGLGLVVAEGLAVSPPTWRGAAAREVGPAAVGPAADGPVIDGPAADGLLQPLMLK